MNTDPTPAAPQGYCCPIMRRHSRLRCDRHSSPAHCPDVLVAYTEKYGPTLPVRDGGSSFVVIAFCPWCGTKIDGGVGTATPPDVPLPCDFNRHGLGIWASSDGWTVEQMPAGEVQVSLSDHRDPPGGETFFFEADLAAAIGAAAATPGEPSPPAAPEIDWRAAYNEIVGAAARSRYLEERLAEVRDDLLDRCDTEDRVTGEYGWIQTTEIRALLSGGEQ